MTFLDKDTLNQLYRFGIALTGNEQDSQDVLQTAIERFLRNKPQKITHKTAYLRTIMRNYWYDELRKQKHHQQHVQALTIEQDIISIHSQSLEDVYIDQQELQTHWDDLQDSQRELLYLHCVLEYTAQEISDELNCPRGTVLARIHRLKKQLQKAAAANDSQGSQS
jgi:RNA polymerase sigma-70 factor (ECF subfamily)